MHSSHSLRAPLLADALRRAAAPALAISAFVAGVAAASNTRTERLRRLRWDRSRIVAGLVHNRRHRRGVDGRFLPIRPLELRLADINAELHVAP